MPVIGVTGRRLAGSRLGLPPGFSDAPVDAYVAEYASAVLRAGGVPLHLPLDADPSVLAGHLDALLLSGGADVDPARYGAPADRDDPRIGPIEPARDDFEVTLLHAVVAAGKPVLGICRGAQLINVAFGGTLIADLPGDLGEVHGGGAAPRAERRHPVRFASASLAERLYGPEIAVNSFHHQAIDRPGDGVAVTGRAPDGVVEAIEIEERRVFAVQWHPEALDRDPAFGWLVEQAARS